MWILAPVWLIIIIIAIILSHPKIKGLIGERRVRKQLSKLPTENYKILNDLIIKGRKVTSQIDHIVISPYGIFVIETKNYKGWIHGSEDSEYWTQTFYKYKTKFRNPIKQNWGHIYKKRKGQVLQYHIYELVSDIRKPGNIHNKVGSDFPGETFRVLKEKEEKEFGEYRTCGGEISPTPEMDVFHL
jgi:hypothetical protein